MFGRGGGQRSSGTGIPPSSGGRGLVNGSGSGSGSGPSGSGSGKISRLSRQKSIMIVESNPLEGEGKGGLGPTLKVENLNHAILIAPEELKKMIKTCEGFLSNEDLLKFLDEAKNPYLFTSDGLAQLVEVTTSIKTKIAIIQMIGPRLTDPKTRLTYFTGLFRYMEEKTVVEEVLKARAHVLTTTLFSRRGGIQSFSGRTNVGRNPLGIAAGDIGGAGGGRLGGRLGAASKSANWHPVHKPNQYTFERKGLIQTPSDDSVEPIQPTVFGFDAVLNALDNNNPGQISKGGSTSLETIKEDSANIENENLEEDEEEERESADFHEHGELFNSEEGVIYSTQGEETVEATFEVEVAGEADDNH